MNFLEKLDFLMKEKGINKNTLSKESNIPYTTIDGFYKKGFQNTKLQTLKKLAEYFGTSLDYLMNDNVTDRNYGKHQITNTALNDLTHISQEEKNVIDKYRKLDSGGRKVVSMLIDIELNRIKDLKTSKPRPIPYYNVYANATEPKPEPKTISLPMYDDMYASAGYGEYMDYTTCSAVNVNECNVPPGVDFIVKVAGDSMEPEIPNGCKIYVKQDSDVHPGEIGLFQISNNLFVKKCTDDGLISLNDKYDPIKYDGTESIVCVGKFLGIVDDDDII